MAGLIRFWTHSCNMNFKVDVLIVFLFIILTSYILNYSTDTGVCDIVDCLNVCTDASDSPERLVADNEVAQHSINLTDDTLDQGKLYVLLTDRLYVFITLKVIIDQLLKNIGL